MTGDPLWFEELRLRRMPGFETEGFTLAGLSPGINLIHGPNGSGKSTTARAIARLLWPSLAQAERVSLSGRFRLGGAEWEVEVEGGRGVHRRGGAECPAPVLPPMEGHERYRLSLHDLLRERDESFASAIVHESAGGYNVRRAAEALEPREIRNRRTAEQEALERARAELDAAVAEQRRLRESELHLEELREQKAAAERAMARVGLLEAALEHAAARATESDVRVELERFPMAMGRVGGDEYERLCALRERLRKVGEEAARAEEAAAEARAAIGGSGIPESALETELLHGLEQDWEALREAEREAAQSARARAAAEAKLADERGRVPGALDDARLVALDAGAMRRLAAFARRAEEVRAQRMGLEAQLAVLGEPRAEVNVDRLDDGVRILQRWLSQPAPAADGPVVRRVRGAGLAAALLLVALGVGLGIMVSPWYAAVAVAGAVLLWLLRAPSAPPAPDAREVHRADYGRLGLEEPAVWEPEAVEAVLAGLRERAADGRTAEDVERRRREVQERWRGTMEVERELEAEREELAGRLGVEPGIDAGMLTVLAEALSRWQAAHAELEARGREYALAVEQAEQKAGELRARLAPLGFSSLATSGEIAGAIQTFRARRQALEGARRDLEEAQRTRRRLAEEQGEREEEMRKIFTTLGLDPDADDTVRDWCEWRAAYLKARDGHLAAESALQRSHSRLLAQGGDDALTARPLAELEVEIGEERARAARRDEAADQISRTEALVEEAKRAHNIEEALARVEAAEDALREARERDTRSAIARELLAYLERATRDHHLPAVFHRAREIFARITHGRYTLRLRQEQDPQFLALDNQERRERTLDELSSGSRVQLLMAVRIAFVERQEQGVKLPLILDEVLGNTDDERARAVMEATLELARQGRQIFYFTAQADEVARWRALVGAPGAGVELNEIDLLRARGLERALEIPALMPAVRRLPPAPEGAGHAEYGRRLGVPRLDRATVEPSVVHLWYLVEEPEVLHRLLLIGPDRWGPLEALMRDGGRPLVDDRLHEELRLYGRALEGFCEAARIGVGLPVDRGALEDSGAVSAVFLGRLEELTRSVGGEGGRLMEALEQGLVTGFRRNKLDDLRSYLQECGYLPENAPLGLAEVRMKVMARVAAEVQAGQVAIDRLDRLVGRLWVGVGGG